MPQTKIEITPENPQISVIVYEIKPMQYTIIFLLYTKNI